MTTVTTPHIIEGAALAHAIPNVTLPQVIRERARQHPWPRRASSRAMCW